jgi:hypothetical protein
MMRTNRNKKNNKNNKSRGGPKSQIPRMIRYYDQPTEKVTRQLIKQRVTNYGFNVDNLGEVGFIYFPAQGVTVNDRVGDAIQLKEIEFTYSINLTTPSSDLVRVIVFQTTGVTPTGLPPALTDVLEINSVLSPLIVEGQTWLKVIYDAMHTMDFQSSTQTVARKNRLTPAVSDIRFINGTIQAYSGQVWYLVLGLNAGAPVNGFQLVSTLWYTD